MCMFARVARRSILPLPLPLLIALASPASAQLIPIRTVRLAQGDQFDILPSVNRAMGGVSIALADSLLDPFINPAKGARIGASSVFGSPVLYHITSNAGGGRTLPLGALLRSGPWFGGLALALQQVDASRTPSSGNITIINNPAADGCPLTPGINSCPAVNDVTLPAAERTHGNQLAQATLGRAWPASGVSVGASVLWARLTGVDGVDALFPASARMSQSGHDLDLRIGALKEWAGNRALEALVIHDRFGMADDVTYLDNYWDPGTQRVLQRPRMEENLDRSNTWGLHLTYQQPLGGEGWRVGWLATGNRISQPRVPEYDIASTPRGPGSSWAYDVGLGVARRQGSAQYGLDAIFEPIWTTTGSSAATPIETRLGDTIPAGGRTVENRYRFGNALLRIGVADEAELEPGTVFGLQLGLAVRAVRYRLTQQDNVQDSTSTQRQHWIEWTPTWGLSVRFAQLEIRYRGQVTNGTSRPGALGGFCVGICLPPPPSGGVVVGPAGFATMTPVHVFSHQVSVSLPLR